MIKTYRKTATIQAEQFDGSDEMIERYGIHPTEINDNWTIYELLTSDDIICIHIGDWIASDINDCYYPIADDVFKETYAEVDEC
jgi:hypothetical protein